MQFYKTTINGSEVNVIFTGKNYFFHNSFFGWLCIAERTEESYERAGVKDSLQEFVLYVGNRHCSGSTSCNNNEVVKCAKRVIKKYENLYIRVPVRFNIIDSDLNKTLVEVSYDLNHF